MTIAVQCAAPSIKNKPILIDNELSVPVIDLAPFLAGGAQEGREFCQQVRHQSSNHNYK
jgi:hypothetical protein